MIIDSHIHCGKGLSYETVVPFLKKSGIEGACLFAPVEEVYDSYDPDFQDAPEWQLKRKETNRYLLEIARTNQRIFPYLFVWNDFDCDELSLGYRGIKWHRHEGEPTYNYTDKRCPQLIGRIIELNLPVVFEESYSNTLDFINKLAHGATVIIPHLGWLNGGFFALDVSGIWRKEKVYADSSLASSYEIKMFLKNTVLISYYSEAISHLASLKMNLKRLFHWISPTQIRRRYLERILEGFWVCEIVPRGTI